VASGSNRDRGSKGTRRPGKKDAPFKKRPVSDSKRKPGGGRSRPESSGPPRERQAPKIRQTASSRQNLRGLAARILGEVLDRKQPLKSVLQREQDKLAHEPDRSLLRELTTGVLRHLPHLDWAVDELTTRGIVETQQELIHVLRVGAYQILMLSRIPVYAAVDECVDAAKRIGPGAGGFVNGILRSLAEHRAELLEGPYRFPGREGAAMRLGVPDWLLARYERRFGAVEAERILSAFQHPSGTTVFFPSATSLVQGRAILDKEGISYQPDPVFPLTLRIPEGNPARSEAFNRGLFYVCDPASQVPALLLPLPGASPILDLCAAPGGKTVVLSSRKARSWILSTDVNRRRISRIKENLSRMSISGVRMAQVNVEGGLPFPACMESVLLDAPCSSLGTLRKNPEIRWQINESDLETFHEREASFLEKASEVIRPGGYLLYSVCSLETEETSNVIGTFLERHRNFALAPLKPPSFLKGLMDQPRKGDAYCLPHRHDWDGFYVALLRRRPDR
jgi:16S rRNA (cytosine967-C5)-methyltransferase